MFFHDEMVTENYITNKTANLYKTVMCFLVKAIHRHLFGIREFVTYDV